MLKKFDYVVTGVLIADAIFLFLCMVTLWIPGMVAGLIIWVVSYNLAEYLEVKMYDKYYRDLEQKIREKREFRR